MYKLLWIGSSLLCFSVAAVARQSAPAANSHTVSIEVAVTGSSGQAETGLQQQDFTVTDNKKPQQILSFQPANHTSDDPPMQLILVIDELNTPLDAMLSEMDQIKAFLRQNGGRLAQPVSLVFFSQSGAKIQPEPSLDGNELSDVLDENAGGLKTIRRSSGFYGDVERFQSSLDGLTSVIDFEARKPGRKMLVWISPGWPLLSSASQELSDSNRQQLFGYLTEISNGLGLARTILYSLDPLGTADTAGFRTTAYRSYLKPVSSQSHVDFGNLALQTLATQSGGRVLNSNNDITAQITNCLADENSFYTLSYGPPPAGHPNEYHAIQVKVAKPGFSVRTRAGYYAQQ